jgi:TPR repeat protein
MMFARSVKGSIHTSLLLAGLSTAAIGCAARPSGGEPTVAAARPVPFAPLPPLPEVPVSAEVPEPVEHGPSAKYRAALADAQALCELGHGGRCVAVALHHQNEGEDEWPTDLAAAATLFARACALDVAEGCLRHGVALVQGSGVPADLAAGLLQVQRGCDLGHIDACEYIAMNEDRGEEAGARAARVADERCRPGRADACFAAGDLYLREQVVPRDEKKAFRYLDRACKAGHVRACQGVARMYEKGVGVRADPARALRLHRKHCDSGDLDSCCYLGLLAAEGRLVERAPEQALARWDDACNRGSGSCCLNAGKFLGDGLPADPTRRLAYYQKACDAGEPEGCGLVGDQYEYGSAAVTIDLEKARDAYLRACRLRDFRGCEFAHRLGSAAGTRP